MTSFNPSSRLLVRDLARQTQTHTKGSYRYIFTRSKSLKISHICIFTLPISISIHTKSITIWSKLLPNNMSPTGHFRLKLHLRVPRGDIQALGSGGSRAPPPGSTKSVLSLAMGQLHPGLVSQSPEIPKRSQMGRSCEKVRKDRKLSSVSCII